jgi:hypothetical protein
MHMSSARANDDAALYWYIARGAVSWQMRRVSRTAVLVTAKCIALTIGRPDPASNPRTPPLVGYTAGWRRRAARMREPHAPAAQLLLLTQRLRALSAATAPTAHAALPGDAARAAVLVPLLWRAPPGGATSSDAGACLRVLLTLRAQLSTHAGEAAFPGGRRDAADTDDAATALREAHECALRRLRSAFATAC